MTNTKTTPVKQVTYLGVPAEVTEVRTAGPVGERVTVTHWLADGQQPANTTTLTHVKGDGRKPTFQVFGRQVLANTPLAEGVEAAKRMLEVTQ